MISLEWVKDYIDIEDQDLKELAVKITKAGINVEKVITNHIDHLVIGKVVECKDHPNSDHLHVCQVEIGNGYTTQIVCGAENVKEGIKVIVAMPGAVLPGDFEIKASKIRGEESNGMICALFELGLEEKTDETYAKGIHVLADDAPVGEDPMKYLGLDDTRYELDIHKHRNNDCYYHIGFAYEIAAILNRKVTLPERSYKESKEKIADYINLKVETQDCPYYSGKIAKNVVIKESPDFIKKRLVAAGMRSINNVVDISNYVMLEYGQPLHFFDYDKLGKQVLVRNAKEGEEIVTLDGKERILEANDIVITDGKEPVCIAGIMGGLNSDVDENTKTIFIESAIFNPVQTRYTSARLNLKSEASIRYGKGLSEEYTKQALDRACHLLEKYADATIISGSVLENRIPDEKKTVTFRKEEVNKLLGIEISESDMEHELDRLDFPYTLQNGVFTVEIPKRRLDIDPNVNDIAEEIGRLYGYQNLVSTLPRVPIRKGAYVGAVALRKDLSKRLRSLGLNEVKTYTLTSPTMASKFRYETKEQIVLPNPMSVDKSVIRTSILPSLLTVYEYNKARKVSDVMIYEIANTYDKNREEDAKVAILMKGNYIQNSWSTTGMKTDFYLMKGICENVLNYLGFQNRYTFQPKEIADLHPGISAEVLLDRKPIGIIGKVHPSTCKDDVYVMELSMTALMKPGKNLKFKAAPKYPEISKDMAFIVSKDVTNDQITNVIRRAGGRNLVDISVFDVYVGENVGEGNRSIAYTVTFNDPTRTLNDEEVMQVFNKIIEEVCKTCHATLRDK